MNKEILSEWFEIKFVFLPEIKIQYGKKTRQMQCGNEEKISY